MKKKGILLMSRLFIYFKSRKSSERLFMLGSTLIKSLIPSEVNLLFLLVNHYLSLFILFKFKKKEMQMILYYKLSSNRFNS